MNTLIGFLEVPQTIHSPSIFRDNHFIGQTLELGPQVSVLERQRKRQSLIPADSHGTKVLPRNHRPLVASLFVVLLGSRPTLSSSAVPFPSTIFVHFPLAISFTTGWPCWRTRCSRCWLHLSVSLTPRARSSTSVTRAATRERFTKNTSLELFPFLLHNSVFKRKNVQSQLFFDPIYICICIYIYLCA